MKRLLIALATASLAIVSFASVAFAGEIVVTPPSGTQYDTFSFIGTGFDAGANIDVAIVTPDGDTYTLQLNGAPAVWVATDGGEFQIDLLPSRDFAGATEGTFGLGFHDLSSGDVFSTTIDISAQ